MSEEQPPARAHAGPAPGYAGASEAAGRAFAAWFFTLPMAVCALLFGRGRRGVQIATYAFAGLSVLWGFVSLRQHSTGGGLVMIAGIAVFVLLGQTSAAIWFRRPPSAAR